MLLPKRVKYRRVHRGRMKGKASLLGLSSHDASEVFLSVLYHAAGLCGSCHSNPVMLEAMKIAGIPYKKRDFRLNMYEFIRMNLWYYLSGPAGENSCVTP